jgi:hypothetical protein
MSTGNKQFRETFLTPAFRLSYPALFQPRETLNSKPEAKDLKYGCTMLFPKKAIADKLKAEKHTAATWIQADGGALWTVIQKVARANFGPDVDLASLKLTKFRDGDKPKDNGKMEENAAGFWVVKTTSKDKPETMRADKTRIVEANSDELYAGCWVRAVLTVAPFLKPQRGITIYLAGIQKLADDMAFSGRPRCEDAFDAVAQESASPAGMPFASPAVPPSFGISGNQGPF